MNTTRLLALLDKLDAAHAKMTPGRYEAEHDDGDWGAIVRAFPDDADEVIVATTEQRGLGARFVWNAEGFAALHNAYPELSQAIREMEADAKLGRALREMPVGRLDRYDDGKFDWREWDEDTGWELKRSCDTPEEALGLEPIGDEP